MKRILTLYDLDEGVYGERSANSRTGKQKGPAARAEDTERWSGCRERQPIRVGRPGRVRVLVAKIQSLRKGLC